MVGHDDVDDICDVRPRVWPPADSCPDGTMILRATDFDLDILKRIATKGNGALAALDAAGSMDPREHGVGARTLTKYLQDFARG